MWADKWPPVSYWHGAIDLFSAEAYRGLRHVDVSRCVGMCQDRLWLEAITHHKLHYLLSKSAPGTQNINILVHLLGRNTRALNHRRVVFTPLLSMFQQLLAGTLRMGFTYCTYVVNQSPAFNMKNALLLSEHMGLRNPQILYNKYAICYCNNNLVTIWNKHW